MADWPPWFQRVMEGAREDLLNGAWPPPPKYTQEPNGTWKREQWTGWGTLVTYHHSLEEAQSL